MNIQASSAIDCSDGLAKSLYFICEMSNVGIDIEEIDCNDWVSSVAKQNDIKITDLVLYSGEELGIIFTSARNLDATHNLQRIGKIVVGEIVRFQGKKVEQKGWDHFDH